MPTLRFRRLGIFVSTVAVLCAVSVSWAQDIGGGRIAYGDTVQGSITVDVPREEWAFRAKAGDVVTVRIRQQGDYSIDSKLYDEYGLEIVRINYDYSSRGYVASEVYLPASGVYTISVQPSYQNTPGQYTLSLELARQTSNALEPIEAGGPISYGGTYAGHLYSDEAYDQWTFSGQRGDTISIRSTQVTDVNYKVVLYDEAGVSVAWANWDYSANAYVINQFVLPTTGAYSLVVQPGYSGSAGYYRFSLALNQQNGDDGVAPLQGGAIEYGQLVVGRLTEQVNHNDWTIQGNEGDVVTANLKNITYFDTPNLRLYGSTSSDPIARGDAVPNTDNREIQIWKFQLPRAGTFTIRVGFDYSSEAGYYELLVSKEGFIPTITDGGEITLGETLGGEFTADNGEDEWRFAAQADNPVTILMKRLSGNVVCDFELLGPSGDSIAFADPSANRIDAELIEFKLPADGVYTIVARPFARNQAGIYSISITTGAGANSSGSAPPTSLYAGVSPDSTNVAVTLTATFITNMTIDSPTPPSSVGITGVVSTTQLNVRSGPGPEYDSVTTLSGGQMVVPIGRNEDGSWLQIEQPVAGWVNTAYIEMNSSPADLAVTFVEMGAWGPSGASTGVQARTTSVVRLRGGPGTNYQQLTNPDTLKANETVDVVGRDDSGEWLQVNIGNRSAWISAMYATLIGHGDIPVTSGR